MRVWYRDMMEPMQENNAFFLQYEENSVQQFRDFRKDKQSHP